MATATSPAAVAHAPLGIALDVNDLERSCTFYKAILGFEVVATTRSGLIYESRTLRSPLVPHLDLILRGAFGKRATGGGPGSLLAITLRVSDPASMVERLTPLVKWIGAAPGAEAKGGECVPARALRFADPDGYHIELVGG
ncbi:MAG: VOC family protein [Phycisphaerales bacterium]